MKSSDVDVASNKKTATPTSNTLSEVGTLVLDTLGPETWKAKVGLCAVAAIFGWGIFAYIHQLRNGLAVTAMTDYFSWGVYIINFVFFIGISMAGSLISAILRLTGADWRHPITRIAEVITVFALLTAALMIIVDMGRPDRVWYILVYGRLQSPIIWDVLSLTSYLTGSLLFLYLPLIPDLAILRDQQTRFSPWRLKLYHWMSLGWTGTRDQRRRLDRCLLVMSIVIIPVAISIHTVTAWLFGMTLRPGWHSTIIGPDFVFGALYSGVAAVITVMALARRKFKLHSFITERHFLNLGVFLLVLCACYLYFAINEYIGSIYTREKIEYELIETLFQGTYALQFWSTMIIGLIVPGILLTLPWTRNVPGIFIASILVNVGMWLKRYIIIAPTLSVPHLPPNQPIQDVFGYIPTWTEWSITAGAIAGFCLLYCLFVKMFPIISIWETEGGHDKQRKTSGSKRKAGGLQVPKDIIALLCFGLSIIEVVPHVAAAETATPQPEISLETIMEEGNLLLLATVTLEGEPLEDYQVGFFVDRTFGRLLLGEDTTLDDGTAAVPFPVDLPGNANGEITVRVIIISPDTFEGTSMETKIGGARKFVASPEPIHRAFWASRPPPLLVVSILSILAVVWGSFGYVVWQLILLAKGRKA